MLSAPRHRRAADHRRRTSHELNQGATMTAITITPTTYTTMPIAGQWRAGTSTHTTVNLDPWNGAELTLQESASTNDVDDAFAAAVVAQSGWADATPRTRADVLRHAANLLQERHDDTIWWLVHEAGATLPLPRSSGTSPVPGSSKPQRWPTTPPGGSCCRTSRARRTASTVDRSVWSP